MLIVEGDDLRALPGLEVVLEIGRDVECRNGLAGAERLAGAAAAAAADSASLSPEEAMPDGVRYCWL